MNPSLPPSVQPASTPPPAAHEPPRVIASVSAAAPPASPAFTLTAGPESTALVPGQSWTQADHFKWVTRGLIEPPQSFHVHADGTVDLNGERFSPADPAAAEGLTRLLNARHARPAPARSTAPRAHDRPAAGTHGVVYHVRLDPYGHLLIRASRGSDQTETGMRGLAHLATEGWTRPFRSLHVDALQRYVEVNGHRFEPTEAGAAALEAHLTTECAPAAAAGGPASIEVRENPASSTGFDIAFHVTRAGARTEVHGHLTQEKLDALQDSEHCDLLQPGVVLRLAPPFLYFRRRRADGGEVPIPEIGDVKYRSTTAAQLQHLLNHPALRRGGGMTRDAETAPPLPQAPLAAPASAPAHAPTAPTPAAHQAEMPPRPPALRSVPPPLPLPDATAESPDLLPAPFDVARNSHLIHRSVFHALAAAAGKPVQDLHLSLDRVFHNRRFEVVSFDALEVASVLQLRSADFHGFYLVHLSHDRLDLVFAHHGLHFEWGTDRCLVQPAAGAESAEYHEAALLGVGRQRSGEWIFVVTPRFRAWSRRFDPACHQAGILMLDPYEFAAAGQRVTRFWPPSG